MLMATPLFSSYTTPLMLSFSAFMPPHYAHSACHTTPIRHADAAAPDASCRDIAAAAADFRYAMPLLRALTLPRATPIFALLLSFADYAMPLPLPLDACQMPVMLLRCCCQRYSCCHSFSSRRFFDVAADYAYFAMMLLLRYCRFCCHFAMRLRHAAISAMPAASAPLPFRYLLLRATAMPADMP